MEKARWVDFAKFIAIFAVITDHVYGSLYHSSTIQQISYFSVALFILLMGVTTYWSFENSKVFLWNKVIKRIIGILIPYLFSVFVYNCVLFGFFSWIDYWKQVICFNSAGPHYYVLLYIMLIIVSPILYCLVKWAGTFSGVHRVFLESLIGLSLFVLSRVCNIYTDFAGIYGVRLFGGSYIMCLYIGMLFGRCYLEKMVELNKGLAIISCVITIAMVCLIALKGFFFDNEELMGSVVNPPGITLIIYAFSIMISVCCLDHLINKSGINVLEVICNFFAYIGRQTLFIFLYHTLFLVLLNRYLKESVIWIKVPLYYFALIFASILGGYVYILLRDRVLRCYMYIGKKDDKNEERVEL